MIRLLLLSFRCCDFLEHHEGCYTRIYFYHYGGRLDDNRPHVISFHLIPVVIEQLTYLLWNITIGSVLRSERSIVFPF
jgi:hypothetical protein